MYSHTRSSPLPILEFFLRVVSFTPNFLSFSAPFCPRSNLRVIYACIHIPSYSSATAQKRGSRVPTTRNSSFAGGLVPNYASTPPPPARTLAIHIYLVLQRRERWLSYTPSILNSHFFFLLFRFFILVIFSSFAPSPSTPQPRSLFFFRGFFSFYTDLFLCKLEENETRKTAVAVLCKHEFFKTAERGRNATDK